jgi:hypothetical protein
MACKRSQVRDKSNLSLLQDIFCGKNCIVKFKNKKLVINNSCSSIKSDDISLRLAAAYAICRINSGLFKIVSWKRHIMKIDLSKYEIWFITFSAPLVPLYIQE